MIGQTLANFRIEEQIGEGGMGVVYKATDLNLDRLVAIKVLSANLSNDPGLLERFRAEAKAQANLNHANIASLYTLLTVDDRTCIVMEYLEGETLDQMLRRRGLMPWEEAVPLFRQALLGIGFAHRMGIVHRDIKPSNIMINKYGVAKVMDFGIAKVLGGQRLTRTGTQVGTVAYMSPEQIRNKAVDIRSDIYSLGVTLYELLTAHLPFESDSEFQIMSDHVNTPPPPPTRHYPYIPRGIEQCVLKALEKDPNARFQTVEEFGSALEHPSSIDEWLAAHTPQPAPPVVHTGGTAPPSSVSPFAATVLGSTPPPAQITPSPAQITPPPAHATPPPAVPPSSRNNKLALVLGAAALLLIALALGGYELFKPKPVLRTASDSSAHTSSVPVTEPISSPQQQPPATSTSSETDTASQIDTSALTKGTASPAKDTNPPAATETSTRPAQKATTTTTRASRARNTEPPQEQAQVQTPAPIQAPPPVVQPAQNQVPPQTQQPQPSGQFRPQPPASQTSVQQQLRNGAAVFMVEHRHIEFNDRFNSMKTFCSGTLTILQNGIIKYDCIQSQDRRCDHVTFSAADVKQVKVMRDGGIHIATRRMGNWDFFGPEQQIQGALSAITQVMEQAR